MASSDDVTIVLCNSTFDSATTRALLLHSILPTIRYPNRWL